MSLLQHLDIGILRALNGLAGRHPSLDALMLLLTLVGTGGAIFIALAALLALRPQRRRAALHLLAAMAVSGAVEELLKALIMRPRPPLALPPGSLHLIHAVPASSALPSGHATVAFAAAAALWQRDRALGAAAGLLAVLISLSRVYLGVHYPSDVLAGALLGVAGAYAAGRWLDRYTLKRK